MYSSIQHAHGKQRANQRKYKSKTEIEWKMKKMTMKKLQ